MFDFMNFWYLFAFFLIFCGSLHFDYFFKADNSANFMAKVGQTRVVKQI